jgi:Flp pilus assembly protein TadG
LNKTAARAEGDRGAVLVEFAFVFPIIVMLLFGLVSAGMAWNQNLAMASAARAGGRYAATLRTASTGFTSIDDYLDAVAQRVVDSSEGALATTVAGRVICVAYVHDQSNTTYDKTRSRTETGTNVTRADSSCYSDNQSANETHIQISVERTTTIQTGFWSQSVTLRQRVVYRYEESSGI